MIKTIICGCGKETDKYYGWPDDVLYCKECYIENQTYYIQHEIDDLLDRISTLNEAVIKRKILLNKINLKNVSEEFLSNFQYDPAKVKWNDDNQSPLEDLKKLLGK